VETALGRQRLRGEVHDGDTAADGGEARDTEAAEEEPVEATSVA